MKITDVRIRSIRFILPKPQSNNRWTWQNMDHSIIEVFTDEGITGIGAGGGIGVDHLILEWARRVVIGEGPVNYGRIWKQLYIGLRAVLTRETLTAGEAIDEIRAVDTAVWDIIGKVLNRPVYQLLGGARDKVRAYASGGHYISTGIEELKSLEEEMGGYVDAGFKAVKMRVGRFSIKEDA